MNLRKLFYTFHLHSWLHQNKSYKTRATGRRVFVFLAADYGNLGDVAITYAQEKLLKEHFSDFEVIDVPISKTLSLLRPIKRLITQDDIITITGGGNLGELYGDIELLRLMVIRMFPKNRVIVFPQTTDYSGQQNYLFRLAQNTYNRHPRLTLLAREKVSYEKLSEWFPSAKIHLVPDVVMTLDRWASNVRSGILLCLRNDKEKNFSNSTLSSIKQEAKQLQIETSFYDTHVDQGKMSIDVRMHELVEIWRKFSSAQLVVTDRLHGMIFAYITGTPAVVFPNNNFKIEKCYEWISNCGYIFFCKTNEFNLKEALSVKPDRNIFLQNHHRFTQIIEQHL